MHKNIEPASMQEKKEDPSKTECSCSCDCSREDKTTSTIGTKVTTQSQPGGGKGSDS